MLENYLDIITNMENFVDGLVDFDKYGVMIPCLATDWEISDDELTYTFHIREGVNWYTCDGEEYAPVTAHDFVDAAKWLLNKLYGVSTP